MEQRYELGRCIGKGHFSFVVEAISKQTKQRVAIKALDLSRVQDTTSPTIYLFIPAEQRVTLHAEIQILKGMKHLNVIGCLDSGEDFVAMEFMQLGDLHSVLHPVYGNNSEENEAKNQLLASLSIEIRLEIALQVARGMSYAHLMHVIHADLHSANILVFVIYLLSLFNHLLS